MNSLSTETDTIKSNAANLTINTVNIMPHAHAVVTFGTNANRFCCLYLSNFLNATTVDVNNLNAGTIKSNTYINTTSNGGFTILAQAGGTITYTGTDYKNAGVNGIASFSDQGVLQKSVATVSGLGEINAPVGVQSMYYRSTDGINGFQIPPTVSSKIIFQNSEYKSADRLCSFDADGSLKQTTATLTSVGVLKTASVLCNNLSNATNSASISITDTSVGDIRFSGSKYNGGVTDGQLLSLQSGVLTPINAPAGGGLAGVFSDFRVKIPDQTEVNVNVYITKVGKMVHIAFPSLAPIFTATTNVVESYLVSHADLKPDPVHVVRHFAASEPHDLTAVKMLGITGNQYYLEFSKTVPWTVVGGSIHPHTLSYQTTTTTLPSTGICSWGSAYKPYAGPALVTPVLTSNTGNPDFSLTFSDEDAPSFRHAFRAFNNNTSDYWATTNGTMSGGAGVPSYATSQNTFNSTTGLSAGGVNGPWLKINLSSEKSFTYFTFLNKNGSNKLLQWKIYASNTDDNYVEIYNQNTDFVYTVADHDNAFEPNISLGINSYRYIVIHVFKCTAGSNPNIYEMRFGKLIIQKKYIS